MDAIEIGDGNIGNVEANIEDNVDGKVSDEINSNCSEGKKGHFLY